MLPELRSLLFSRVYFGATKFKSTSARRAETLGAMEKAAGKAPPGGQNTAAIAESKNRAVDARFRAVHRVTKRAEYRKKQGLRY